MNDKGFEPQQDDIGRIEQSRSIDVGRPFGRFLMQVLWPAFLGAAAATGVFFSAVDPLQVDLFGVHLENDRLSIYTLGFLVFWVLFSFSGALTYMMVCTQCEEQGGRR